jgi:hypothetical protein
METSWDGMENSEAQQDQSALDRNARVVKPGEAEDERGYQGQDRVARRSAIPSRPSLTATGMIGAK